MSEKTTKKVQIFGWDHSKLLDIIDAAELPVEYGGTNTR